MKSTHPVAPGAPPPVLCLDPLLTMSEDSNVAFYNLLSACALFCIKSVADVGAFYVWSENCTQVVPMTRDYPFTAVVTTVIPSWASKKLSSSGNFDPSAVMDGQFSYLPLFSSLSRIRLFRFPPHELLTDLPWSLRKQENGLLCRSSLR